MSISVESTEALSMTAKLEDLQEPKNKVDVGCLFTVLSVNRQTGEILLAPSWEDRVYSE